MKKISRKTFLKANTLALTAVLSPGILSSKNDNNENDIDVDFMNRLVKSNDEYVDHLFTRMEDSRGIQYYRYLSGPFANFSAAYCHPDSSYFKSEKIVPVLEMIIDKLLELQYPNGTLDSGGNRQSPPDTAFLLESLCPAAIILKQNDFETLINVKQKLDKFLLAAGEGLRSGGVHTPNHRWEVSSMLARLYSIYKDQRYLDRAEEWLAEGIYINADGQYPERSRNYATVENNAFIHLGEILKRPEYFDIVQKNLVSTFYYMEPDGELVCLDSRRQDQYRPISILKSYLDYRYLAIIKNDSFLSAITREIESLDGFDRQVLSRSLPFFMTSKVLQKKLPKSSNLPETYTKYFSESDLVRIKDGDITASIYGGNDKPLIIASGRSCIPTFFTFRKGSAILEYARLSTSFFNTGYFRSDGLEKQGDTYILSEVKEGHYFHPLPENKRNKNGDYKLTESTDRRFWSKLDFPSRPKTILKLDTTIKIDKIGKSFTIDFNISGVDNVEVTVDFCFKNGGVLENVESGRDNDDFFFKEGTASFVQGKDSIHIGPGKFEHANINRLDGEVYSTHFGSIKGEGTHLYLTGMTPFKHKITIS